MSKNTTYTVKQVAELSGVTVRTLHHYDSIGLLKPSSHSLANYRLYNHNDLERLQEILFFRELGFSLSEIKDLTTSPAYARKPALETHLALLQAKQEQITKLISQVQVLLDQADNEGTCESDVNFTNFKNPTMDKLKDQYAAEVKAKYGNTPEYQEWQERQDALSPQEQQDNYQAYMQLADDFFTQLAQVKRKHAPTSPQAYAQAEYWHNQINQNWYQCSLEVYASLADIYVADERFAANIDKYEPGLAQWFSQAVKHYCATKPA